MSFRHVLFSTLAAGALVTLTACGGGSDQTTGSPESGTDAPAATAPATTQQATPADDAPMPCEALTAEEVSEIIGAQVTEARPSELLGNQLCSYEAGIDDPFVTSQVSPLRGSLEDNARAALGPLGVRTTSPVDVPGTREAVMGEGSTSGVPVAGVAMDKDGHLFVVVVGQDDAARARDIAVKAATVMAA